MDFPDVGARFSAPAQRGRTILSQNSRPGAVLANVPLTVVHKRGGVRGPTREKSQNRQKAGGFVENGKSTAPVKKQAIEVEKLDERNENKRKKRQTNERP